MLSICNPLVKKHGGHGIFDFNKIIRTSAKSFIHKMTASIAYVLGSGSHITRGIAFILPVTIIS